MGYRCMVPAMSGLLRSARPCVAAPLTLALVLGINGFVGAIHSVHHIPALVETRSHDAHGHGHGEQSPVPAGAPDETCPVAAAALHLAATAVAALPVLDRAPAGAEMVEPGPKDALRAAWREPGSGRAPPSFRPLPS
jgi:hypothetical protein